MTKFIVSCPTDVYQIPIKPELEPWKASGKKVGMISVSEMAVSLNTISKIRGLLNRFRRLSEYYKDCFDNQSKASEKASGKYEIGTLVHFSFYSGT